MVVCPWLRAQKGWVLVGGQWRQSTALGVRGQGSVLLVTAVCGGRVGAVWVTREAAVAERVAVVAACVGVPVLASHQTVGNGLQGPGKVWAKTLCSATSHSLCQASRSPGLWPVLAQ